MSNVEYPRWVYPPDGGPGCVVQTPDEKPKGWLDSPAGGGEGQSGERIIGQPIFPHPEQPIAPLPPDFPRPGHPIVEPPVDPPPVPEQLPTDDGEDEPARKSKKK